MLKIQLLSKMVWKLILMRFIGFIIPLAIGLFSDHSQIYSFTLEMSNPYRVVCVRYPRSTRNMTTL